jgi:uncharacterized membrane protein (DUF4010 family)
LSLFSGKYTIDLQTLTQATLIAITSNNIMKLGYALSLGHPKIRKPLWLGFGLIILLTIVMIFV